MSEIQYFLHSRRRRLSFMNVSFKEEKKTKFTANGALNNILLVISQYRIPNIFFILKPAASLKVGKGISSSILNANEVFDVLEVIIYLV